MSTAQALPLFIITSPAQEGLQGDSQWVIFCSSYTLQPISRWFPWAFPHPCIPSTPCGAAGADWQVWKIGPQSPPAARVPH